MKICTRCNKEKEKFNKNSKNKDGLSNWCKDCFREYDRIRWSEGDSKRKKANYIARVRKNREFIKTYFESHPCVDCGESDWWALEFDHKEARTKEQDLCKIIMSSGIDRIKKEIEVCDVRCLKCHKKRTIFQLGWWQKEYLIGA